MPDKPVFELDGRDRVLLRRLQIDGRATNAELARAADLSESACLRRVKQFEAKGLIRRFGAVLDARAAGYPLSVFVSVTLSAQSEHALAAFEQAIASIPEIMECHLMTGTADYLLRLIARDIEDLARIHSERLTRLAGVQTVSSSLVLRTVLHREVLPL